VEAATPFSYPSNWRISMTISLNEKSGFNPVFLSNNCLKSFHRFSISCEYCLSLVSWFVLFLNCFLLGSILLIICFFLNQKIKLFNDDY